MKILFCSSEVIPFVKSGGLADVCGALPLALEKIGVDVCVALPYYSCIEGDFALVDKAKDIATTKIGKNIDVYFIKNEAFFNRKGLYGNKQGDYPDNIDRFQYFCKRTLTLLKDLGIKVDIVHCHDWQTALIPVYLKNVYNNDAFYSGIKNILTIHNLAYQGIFPRQEFAKLELTQRLYSNGGFEFHGKVNLLKGGILFSDCLTTVSREYADEIQNEKFGCGLDDIIRKKEITGILNGLDYNVWNPETDAYIVKTYSAETIDNKKINKQALQKELRLPAREDIPVFGFVGRLSHQKGLDLLMSTIDRIAALDVQMVFLGTGDHKYHALLKDATRRFPDKIAVSLRLDEAMAHKVYAGCDIFLMPSAFEPCGLSQLISFRYATVPLVFKTGGLKETVVPFDVSDCGGNGFVFDTYTEDSLIDCIKKAIDVFRNKKVFTELMKKVMRLDFSWDTTAGEYKHLYEDCI